MTWPASSYSRLLEIFEQVGDTGSLTANGTSALLVWLGTRVQYTIHVSLRDVQNNFLNIWMFSESWVKHFQPSGKYQTVCLNISGLLTNIEHFLK